MEHLDLDGKRYMKVSSAARETGYTADYIGQLCRARKIDAKLVGRTWYVAADEISDHRRTRGRSSHEKVRQNIREQLSANQETTIPIKHGIAPHRKNLLSTSITYHSDELDLIPTVHSVAVVSNDREEAVPTAHEQHIKVEEKDAGKEVPVLTPVQKGEVKWNGTIVVEPLESAEENQPETQRGNTMPTERHVKLQSEKERNIKPNLVISEVSGDPLEAKKRFLERMNLAHELNEPMRLPPVPRAPDPIRASRHDKQHEKWGQRSKKAASMAANQQKTHRFTSYALGTAAVLGVFFLTATTFLESSSEYRAPSGTGSSVFLSTFRVSSLETAREILTESISSIRLLSQISLF